MRVNMLVIDGPLDGETIEWETDESVMRYEAPRHMRPFGESVEYDAWEIAIGPPPRWPTVSGKTRQTAWFLVHEDYRWSGEDVSVIVLRALMSGYRKPTREKDKPE